ncbi:hypothetical protein FRC01_013080 [Tulasnella sp. 417]|nr:hypothetical protein FRC01_013080 [Tulasnella sp. 417]
MYDSGTDTELSAYGPVAITAGSSILVIQGPQSVVNMSNLLEHLLTPNQRQVSRLAELPATPASTRCVFETLQTQANGLELEKPLLLLTGDSPRLRQEKQYHPTFLVGMFMAQLPSQLTPRTLPNEGSPAAVAQTAMELDGNGDGISEEVTEDPSKSLTLPSLTTFADHFHPFLVMAIAQTVNPPPPVAAPEQLLPSDETTSMIENTIWTMWGEMQGGMTQSTAYSDLVAQEEQHGEEDEMDEEQLEATIRSIQNTFEHDCGASSSGIGSLDVFEFHADVLQNVSQPPGT